MVRTIILAVTLAAGLTGVTGLIVPTSADAQMSRHSVKKKRTTVKQTRRHTSQKRHDHHNRSHVGVHGGVHVQIGTPHYYYGHGHYGHVHHHGCEHWAHYRHTYGHPHPTQVVVIDATPIEPVFVLPTLDCPIRTDEKRIGREQWCETPRGNRHGPYRRWYDDGTLAAQGEYEYDQKEGVWIEFHPNGALREEGQYDDGARTGTWVTWGADGEELVVIDY